MTKNLNNMPVEELYRLRNQVEEEIQKRNFKRKEELWHTLVEAIKAYTAEFGDIEIQHGYDYLCNQNNYNTIGEIW